MRDREDPDEWTAIAEGGSVVLVRDVECIICCKRRRDRCAICEGTGRRVVRHPLSRAEALLLSRSLAAALDGSYLDGLDEERAKGSTG